MSATSRRREEAYSRRESRGGGGRRGGENDRGPREDRESRRQYNMYGSANEHSKITSRDRDNERDSSRVKESETNRETERESGRRDWSREKERYSRGDTEINNSINNSRSTKDDRNKGKLDEYEHHHVHNNDCNRENFHDRDRRHKRRSCSRSKDRFNNQNKSRSPSSKSNRTSGFDMAPAGAAMLPDAAAFGGQLLGMAQPLTGLLPTLPLATHQFGSLALMPAQAMTQQATRHARRVYVGGLPPAVNEQTISTFFSHVMSLIGGNTAGPGDAVVNVYINHEKKFAFVEMRSVEEASNAMALDGITFEGVSVRVRRPTDYNPSLAATLGPTQPNPFLNLAAVGLSLGTTSGSEGPDRIFVGGLPYYFTDEQIKELLESFGPLHGFNLVKDRETGNSKGYGFCVYQDPSVIDIACAALNGLKMGEKTLTVRRASASMDQMKPDQHFILQQAQEHITMQKLALQAAGSPPVLGVPLASKTFQASPTRVLCLVEVVSIDELRDDEEYKEILEDMKEESGKFGPLVSIVIPRPSKTGEITPGVGKVFLEFADTAGSARAQTGLHGRKFGGNVVSAAFYPEDKFLIGDYGAIPVA